MPGRTSQAPKMVQGTDTPTLESSRCPGQPLSGRTEQRVLPLFSIAQGRVVQVCLSERYVGVN